MASKNLPELFSKLNLCEPQYKNRSVVPKVTSRPISLKNNQILDQAYKSKPTPSQIHLIENERKGIFQILNFLNENGFKLERNKQKLFFLK